MPRFKPIDYSPRFLAVDLSRQLIPGTFEYALHHLIDHEIDLSSLEPRYRNDEVGASAYDPRVLLKIVLLAYARGIVSSRGIEAACRERCSSWHCPGTRRRTSPRWRASSVRWASR